MTVARVISLLRRHGLAVGLAMGGLALSVGLSASVFSLLRGTVFRGVDAADPAALVHVDRAFRQGVETSWPPSEFESLKRARLATMAAWTARSLAWSDSPRGTRGTALIWKDLCQ